MIVTVLVLSALCLLVATEPGSREEQ